MDFSFIASLALLLFGLVFLVEGSAPTDKPQFGYQRFVVGSEFGLKPAATTTTSTPSTTTTTTTSTSMTTTTTPTAVTSKSALVFGLSSPSVDLRFREESGGSSESYQAKLLRRLERDQARVDALYSRVDRTLGNTVGVAAEKVLSSPLRSGLSQGSGEYFARIGLGTPARFVDMVIDTGSDLSWLQCKPCLSCYTQTDPVFNPAESSSFANVTCTDRRCARLRTKGCSMTGKCLYEVAYGDGSFTAGNLAVESVTFPSGEVVQGVSIGCGHDNEGLFVAAAGLLGLGQGVSSFPSQVAAISGQAFSYCLPDRFSGGRSSLEFGPGSVPAGASFAPLIKNPKLDTFYYLPLIGVRVAGVRLQTVSPSDLSLASTGRGGVIIDSGTAVTRLVSTVYTAMRDAFRAGASGLPTASSFSLFDTCFSLGSRTSIDVPTIELIFQGGATLALPASNYLIPVDTLGTYCFAFAPTTGQLSIIGNLQHQSYRVSFDTASQRVGFKPNQC